MPAAAKKSEKITTGTLASVAELSAVLGLSSNRIYQLSRDGIIVSAANTPWPILSRGTSPIWAGTLSPRTR